MVVVFNCRLTLHISPMGSDTAWYLYMEVLQLVVHLVLSRLFLQSKLFLVRGKLY